MKLTTEIQKKISKLDTVSLTRKVQFGNFQEEKLEYAKSLLVKRGVNIEEILRPKEKQIESTVFIQELYTLPVEELDFEIEETLPICEEVSIPDVTGKPEEKPYTTKKAKLIEKSSKKIEKAKSAKKTGKKEKRIYVAADGKEFTKSALMRRLIRLKNDIKPKELNEQLIDAGFEKAYHSEIQRCRQQMGVFLNKKE